MKSRSWYKVVLALGLLLSLGSFGTATRYALALGTDQEARAVVAAAVGTGFSYQGNLTDAGGPANGNFDFTFSMHDAAVSGVQVGPTLTESSVPVNDGLFAVALDFGAVFDGTALWLEIGVRPEGSIAPYTILSPRQPVGATPYALYSGVAPWDGLTGIPVGFADNLDDDMLAELACADGEIAMWNGTTWICSPGGSGGGSGTITAVNAGEGLTGGGTTDAVTVTVVFTGTGTATTVPRSDHIHDDRYYSETELQTGGSAGVHWDNLTNVPPGFADGTDDEATTIDWTAVQNRPAGLDDGDDNTTYTAGAGLALSGTQFRLTTPPMGPHVERTLDATGTTGRNPAIIIGLDGLPLVSYYDATNGDLKVYHCNDVTCSSGVGTTLDSVGIVGEYTSITIGRDGFGMISYYDRTNGDLKMAHCLNTACTSATTQTVDSTGDVGQWTSITTNEQGYGFISYYDVTNGDLKAAACNTQTCNGYTLWTLDSTGDVGQYTSVVRNGRDYGYISYYDATNRDLKVARCVSMSCANPIVRTVDGTTVVNGAEEDVGLWTSITAAADSMPLVSYVKTNQTGFHTAQVRVAHCTVTTCSDATVETVISGSGISFMGTSITLGPHGLGLMSMTWDTATRIYYVQCDDHGCTDTSINDGAVTTGNPRETTLTIGADGLPVIAYFSDQADDLRLLHCSDITCQPYLRRR